MYVLLYKYYTQLLHSVFKQPQHGTRKSD